MNLYEWVETILFFAILLATVKPFGTFMARVYQGERTVLSPVILPCENLLYRICGVDRKEEMGWKRYAWGMLLLNLVLFVALFAMTADAPAETLGRHAAPLADEIRHGRAPVAYTFCVSGINYATIWDPATTRQFPPGFAGAVNCGGNCIVLYMPQRISAGQFTFAIETKDKRRGEVQFQHSIPAGIPTPKP